MGSEFRTPNPLCVLAYWMIIKMKSADTKLRANKVGFRIWTQHLV